MTTLQVQPPALPPSFDGQVKKMEDRKRSLAPEGDDLAPSRKRLVKDENGQQMRMDNEKEKDVEVCKLFPVPLMLKSTGVNGRRCCRTTKKMPSCVK